MRNGETPDFQKPANALYDEIVIDQESQITPVYLLKLNKEAASKLLSKWQRSTPHKNSFGSSGNLTPKDDLYVPLVDFSTSEMETM
jgi:hypothetical protein